MSFRVRAATSADGARLALIGAATFVETFAGVLDGEAIVQHCANVHTAAVYEKYLADSAATAWIAEAEEGGGPIGYALLARPDLPGVDPAGPDRELKRIYALSKFHGSGIGAALMREAVERAQSQQVPRLLLGVYAENARAIAFYVKSGFQPAGERRFTVGNRQYDDVILARDLD